MSPKHLPPDNINGSRCIISEDVIASIASTAACEIDGIASMARRSDIKGFLTRGKEKRGVQVSRTEDETSIDVYVNIKADTRIPDVAAAVQQNVKHAVQNMTGKPVTKVNIHIEGLVNGNTANG